jgi:hypothetical protein
MNLTMFSVPPAIADAWRWWTCELAGMIPDRWAARRSTRPRSSLFLGPASVTVDVIIGEIGERHMDARALEDLDESAWGELGQLIDETEAQLVLDSPDIHIATLILPVAARSRLKAAVALRLYDIAPLDSELLLWEAIITAQDTRGLHVTVVMARTARIDTLVETFQAASVPMPEIVVKLDNQLIILRRGIEGSSTPEKQHDRRAWAIAGALVLSIPLTTVVAARIITGSNDTRVTGSEDSVRPKLEAERRWRRDEAMRRVLIPILARPSASATIDRLANIIPKSASARSVDQASDRSLAFVVDTSDPKSLADALSVATTLREVGISNETATSASEMRITYRALPR